MCDIVSKRHWPRMWKFVRNVYTSSLTVLFEFNVYCRLDSTDV